MPEITIQTLAEQYGMFLETTKQKIEKFQANGYDTFVNDCKDEHWFKKNFIQENLNKIREAYAFIKVLKNIYRQEFPQNIVRFAENRGFRCRNIITQRPEEDWMLAWDLALHYPLWGWKTYDNHDFLGIGFVREEVKPEHKLFGFVSFVPIIKIQIKENGKPSIEAYEWDIIRMILEGM